MSTGSKPKPECFGRDLRRLLLAAEAAQRADILTYSSGHLGPHSLDQSQPPMDTKKSFWKTSQSHRETPNPSTLQQRRTKALTCVKKKVMKESPSEFSGRAALAESEVSESRQARADHSPHADMRKDISLPNIGHGSSDALLFQPRAFSKKKVNPSSDSEGKQPFWRTNSGQKRQNNGGQLKTNQWLRRQFIAKEDHWDGINAVRKHERKLQEELRKLSVQIWPSRDRLAVFSDVFDDVCESLPVFGRILREIKTEYDLYVNQLMESKFLPHDKSLSTSFEDPSSGKLKEKELKDAEEEVCRLMEEATRALMENKQVKNGLQNVPAIAGPEDSDMKNVSLSELQDSGTAISHNSSIQFKRLQVLNMWREVQQLEEEIQERLVSTVTVTDMEKRIKDMKTETVRLIALNEQLKTTNKNLEDKINMLLDKEKLNKSLRRTLWDEILQDLQTESE